MGHEGTNRYDHPAPPFPFVLVKPAKPSGSFPLQDSGTWHVKMFAKEEKYGWCLSCWILGVDGFFFADCLTESLRNLSRYRISGCMWKWMWKIGKFRMSILCVVRLICNWGWLIDGGFFCVCFVLIFKLWFLYWFKMYRDMIWLNLNSCKFELILELLW